MAKKKRRRLKPVFEYIWTIISALVIGVVCAHFIVRPVQVKGSSMYPTLKDGEYGITNILGTYISGYSRFDVVAIYIPEHDEYIVKRIIGLPGETISYHDDQLYINGEAIEEPFLNNDYEEEYEGKFTTDIEEITLGEDEYYCLGDNRPNSRDSRYYGAFKKDQLTSKGVLIIWPISEWDIVTW